MKLVFVFFSLFSMGLMAADPVVSVTVDKKTYACQTSANPLDPKCVTSLADWCKQNTNYTPTNCFDKATTSCKGSKTTYSGCVTETSEYCMHNTNYTPTHCYDKALESCRDLQPR